MIDRRIRRGLEGLVILASLLVCLSPASASGGINVTDINYWSYADYTRVVVSLSDSGQFTSNRLSNPDRLFIDLKNSRISKELKTSLPVGNSMLKAVRAGQFNESTVRVVLDLGKVRDYKIINLDDPVRIVVDVYGHVAARSTKKRIVIDPGHGGHDPGAIGPNKVMEKDIVLDIALKLKKLLDDDPRFQVFLTRDKDVFIPLPQRTAIANSKDADLFVSIHANSSPRKDARGIETYFLNWTDDEEAMKVAARENQISLRNMKKMKKDNSVLDVIFSDLTRDDKRDKSLQLANYIQNNMVGELGRQYHVVDLRTKWAPFYVLFGADMPSVLVEVSFISNPMEERLLTRDSYRSSLARSIAGGITKFMSVSPDVRTVADVRKSVGSRD